MKYSNIVTLIVSFLFLYGCDERTTTEDNPNTVEQKLDNINKVDHDSPDNINESILPRCMKVFEKNNNIYCQQRNGKNNAQLTSSNIDSSPIMSPDGQLIVFVRKNGKYNEEIGDETEIWITDIVDNNLTLFLPSEINVNYDGKITSFYSPRSPIFSLDGNFIYFEAGHWATSSALHAANIKTKEIQFVSPSNGFWIVPQGEYAGNLIVRKHKYFSAGGSYDAYWLINSKGEEINPVGADEQSVETFINTGLVNAKVQLQLGLMYYEGKDSPEALTKAFEWFQKAALQFEKSALLGDVESQFELGRLYWLGRGVAKDSIRAFEWFEKAANQGHGEAQYHLFMMYHDGDGVPKNLAKESEFLHKAAASGMSQAQYLLGLAYSMGNRGGVNKDKTRAYAWLNLAAVQGDKNAREQRDDFEKQITKQELTEAQQLSSNWKRGDTLLASNDISDFNKAGVQTTHVPTKQKYGTAVIVSKDGHALTNHHVINSCDEIKIAGHEGVAKLITSDSVNDIALLQLPNINDSFAKINPEPNKFRQGEDVLVFGYPLNSVLSSGGNLTFGTVSALSGLNNNTNQIQITAPIQPGSSGSPVMDKKGDIVGIVSMKLDDTKMAKVTGSIGQTVNFAINGQTVKTFLETNNVPYKTGGGFFSMEKNNADIAEEAKKWTVLVECWK